jgi:hypothetical protein
MTPLQKRFWEKGLTPKEVSVLLKRKGLKLSESTIYFAMRGMMTERTRFCLSQVFGNLEKVERK